MVDSSFTHKNLIVEYQNTSDQLGCSMGPGLGSIFVKAFVYS